MAVSLFDIPILFIVFNRIETTKVVFRSIRNIRPAVLYIASDGPRLENTQDIAGVKSVRQHITNNIDWNCKIRTRYRISNLGCKEAVLDAIDWFFHNEEMGIILEDDCAPSASFFPYSKFLLDRYRSQQKIFYISGSNHRGSLTINTSYYYSQFFNPWGWATWRDRWRLHRKTLEDFDLLIGNKDNQRKLHNKLANKKIIQNAIKSMQGGIDTWDYPWFFTCVIHDGFVVTPRNNLVENIGFGPHATHTKDIFITGIPRQELELPLISPWQMVPAKGLDDHNYRYVMGWMPWYLKLMNPAHILAVLKYRIPKVLKVLDHTFLINRVAPVQKILLKWL